MGVISCFSPGFARTAGSLAVILIAISCRAGRPAGEDLIARYFEAVGGKDKIATITGRSARGTFAVVDMGYEGEFTQFVKPPLFAKTEIRIGNSLVASSGVKGGTAWQVNPMTGARVLKGEEARAALRSIALDPVLGWMQDLETAQLQEWKPEATTARVLLKDRNGDQAICEFDQNTGLLSTMITFIGNQRTVTRFSDYRPVDGVTVAHEIATDAGGQISMKFVMTEISHGGDIPPATFDFPSEILRLVNPGGE